MVKKFILLLLIIGIVYTISVNSIEKEMSKIEISSVR